MGRQVPLPAQGRNLKKRTTVTKRWLAAILRTGNLHEVRRKVSAWTRRPEPTMTTKQK